MKSQNKFLQKLAAAVVQRSGISRPTVEVVLPAVFDEIRRILTEGNGCVPIEGFGTLYVKEVPEHEYLYNRNNANRICTVPAKKQIKFAPARNLTDEMNAGKFDAMRRSFTRMPGDPLLRKRSDLRYRPENYDRSKGVYSRSIYTRKDSDSNP